MKRAGRSASGAKSAGFRRGPGNLWTPGFTYAVATFPGSKKVEVHLGVKVTGTSGVPHECDVALIDSAECARSRAGAVHPRHQFLVGAIEAKHYQVSPGLDVGREFIGLASEIGGKKCCLAFPAEASPTLSLLLARRPPECFSEVESGSSAADRLRRVLETRNPQLAPLDTNRSGMPVERSDENGVVIFLEGVPSSGKTSTARELGKLLTDIRIIHADEEIRRWGRKRARPVTPEQMFESRLDLVERACRTKDVIVDGPLPGSWVAKVRRRFPDALIVTLRITETERLAREQVRKRKNPLIWDDLRAAAQGSENLFDLVIDSNGVIRIYDPSTNTLGSYNWDGTIATFFKPDPLIHKYPTNWDYWLSQPGTPP